MPALTQANRATIIHTPLSQDVLCLRSLSVTEQLGRLFQMEADLVGTDANISVNAGGKIQAKAGMDYAMEAGMNIHLKGGLKVVIEAGVQLTLKAGASFIDIGPAGISITGSPLVNINSGGAAGAGSGSSPQAPDAPKDPVEAVDEKPGQSDTA